MITEEGFFVEYSDGFYSKSYERLKLARTEAKQANPYKKLKIFYGILRRHPEKTHIIDDSKLSLVQRINGYK